MARSSSSAALKVAASLLAPTDAAPPVVQTHGASVETVTAARLALAALHAAPEGKARGVYPDAKAASMAILACATVMQPSLDVDMARAILGRPCSPAAFAAVETGNEEVSTLARLLANAASTFVGDAGKTARTVTRSAVTVAGAIHRTERAGGSAQTMIDAARIIARAERTATEACKMADYKRPLYRGPK